MTDKKPAGRPPVNMTQDQQIRLESIRMVMGSSAWVQANGFPSWQAAAKAVAQFISEG